MITETLAEVAAADPMISSTAVVGIIGAITTLVTGLIAKLKLDQAKGESREVTLKKPVPTVQVREEERWATRPELADHVQRTEQGFDQVWKALDADRGVARESLGKIHARIDQQSKATATLQGSVEEVGKNVDRLLDLALNRKPGSRA